MWATDSLDQLAIGRRLHGDRLLDEAVEQLSGMARTATVEAERELVEVVVEMGRAHGALMGAQEPPLEQGRDEMDTRQQLGRRLGVVRCRARSSRR